MKTIIKFFKKYIPYILSFISISAILTYITSFSTKKLLTPIGRRFIVKKKNIFFFFEGVFFSDKLTTKILKLISFILESKYSNNLFAVMKNKVDYF